MEAEEVSTGRGEAAHLLYPDEDEGHRAHEGGLQQAHVPLHPTPSPHRHTASCQAVSLASLLVWYPGESDGCLVAPLDGGAHVGHGVGGGVAHRHSQHLYTRCTALHCTVLYCTVQHQHRQLGQQLQDVRQRQVGDVQVRRGEGLNQGGNVDM